MNDDDTLGHQATLPADYQQDAVGLADTVDSSEVSRGLDVALDEEVTKEHPGRYEREDERLLGRGGIGRVVGTVDRHLGREVALKELLGHSETGSSEPSLQSRARFLREARVTGQLEHPGVVPVYELGIRKDGRLYYTMKLVRGRSLGEALKEAPDLDARLRLLGHFRDLCEAMAYAHSKGVVHRDLKPDNVMVGAFGETVVVDWGLAKVRGLGDLRGDELAADAERLRHSSPAHTVAGAAIGTPAYMSPEQAKGDVDGMDERSDVWSLGAILFELLTGRPVYLGRTAHEVVAQVLIDDPPRVREICPEAPAELAAIADRALQRDRGERYARAAEVAEEIAAWQDGRRVGAYEYGSLELARRFVQRNKVASAAVMLLLACATAASILVFRSWREESAARARADERRLEAERAERRATASERAAEAALAEAYLEKAERALGEGDPAAAAVFAAAALRSDPANPNAEGFSEDARESGHERVVLARSRSSAATGARRHLYDGRLGSDDLEVGVRGAFAPDGQRFAVASWDRGIAIFDLGRRDAPSLIPVEGMRAVWGWVGEERIAVVATGGSGIYEVESGERSVAFPAGTRVVSLGEGEALLGLTSGELVFVDLESGEERARWSSGLPSVERIAWSAASGRVAAASRGGGRVVVFDATTQEVVREELFPAALQSLAYDPAGTTLVVGGQHPRIWFSDDDGERRSVETLGWVGGLTWLEDGRLLASEGSSRIVVRDAASGTILESLHVPAGNGFRLAVGAHERLAAVPARGPNDARRVTLFRPVRDHAAPLRLDAAVRSFAVRDGRLAVLSADGVRVVREDVVERWDLPEGVLQPVAVALGPRGEVGIATSDGAVLVGEDGSFDTVAPAWSATAQSLLGVAFADDGRLFASGEDGSVLIYDRDEGTERIRDHEGAVLGLAVGPRGERFASAARDGLVCLRTVDEIEHALRGHEGLASHAAFSPDGARLVTVDGVGGLKVWDVESGEELMQTRAHRQWINRVAWSPDGAFLATASDDGSVRVWSAEDLALTHIFTTETLAIGVAFDGPELLYHDSSRIHRVRLDADKSIEDPEELLREAELAAGMRLDGLRLVALE